MKIYIRKIGYTVVFKLICIYFLFRGKVCSSRKGNISAHTMFSIKSSFGGRSPGQLTASIMFMMASWRGMSVCV